MKLRLAITGSSGYLAQQLITRLGADPEVEFILGLDIRRRQTTPGCPAEFLEYDLTRPWSELCELFRSHRINTGLHLAWQFNPTHDTQRHRQVDVEGSRGFFQAAAEAGLTRVVYTSSATAYADARNPETPLPEETPVTGSPLYLYSKHKGEVDRMAQDFSRAHPEIQVLILRPSIIIGPHTRNVVSTMTNWPWRSFPWLVQVRGFDPPMQYLSEEDIAEILYRSVKSEATGVINCAGDGIVRLTELARLLGKRPLPLPAGFVYPWAELLWKLRLAPFPSGILDMIRYPWVADNTRMKQALDYHPRLTSMQALETFAAARRRPDNR
ncbi:MAG TPA: NAD-dependent epimerase/dehydratase family protein [Terriglobales bacterium]